ncbi:pirin family protein [Ferrimonas balearica]|uniref:pirin family protein n=1 Tax=Ferrimonas balearica TaxID=44012 RepID=UPI001C99B577|nr:pirin family protein [Ferrimonas balearica]MBY5920657.1 pirin family protein [Ferrimonas balearica]MBY5996658.1 pirin family protein [Ferrimonas balearica]
MKTRKLIAVQASRPTSDGDGVKIRRVAGFQDGRMDPFLMLDELKADNTKDYVGGFPPHPHRGIETLTYMLKGHFRHEDHLGNVGELKDGGAQWMSAGRGVIHSEMPIMTDGQLHGFQIWINLPRAKKMQPADYRDFQAQSIPTVALQGEGDFRLISGTLNGEKGPLDQPSVPMLVGDLRAEGEVKLPIPSEFGAVAYLYQGAVTLCGQQIEAGHMLYFDQGDAISLTAVPGTSAGLIVLAGKPIREPVVHWGPFVMNSMAEIEQAIADYQNGQLTA